MISAIEIASLARNKSYCPKCDQDLIKVIESRKTRDATRRRKKCDRCGHRETTYELDQQTYLEFKKAYQSIQSITKLLNHTAETPKKKTPTCDQCVHMSGKECFFGFPDAGGTFAKDCSLFTLESELSK